MDMIIFNPRIGNRWRVVWTGLPGDSLPGL